MAIFSSIKRAFGFNTDDEEMVDYTADEMIVDQSMPAIPDVPHEPTGGFTADPVLTGEIFEEVIRLFNNFQPDFVKECLNTEAQRQFIIESLDKGIRKRIDDTLKQAYEFGSRQWEDERRTMSEEMGRLKDQYARLEEDKKEFKTAQLSAQRQKRALNERVHDLELQVNTLEAEKEQYELENRSMLNKLRVAGVTGQIPGEASHETNTDNSEQLKTLEEQNAKLQDENARLQDENARLQDENTKLSARIEELTAETADLEEIHQYIERFESIKKKKDNKIAALNAAARRQTAHFEQVETEYKARIESLDKEVDRLRKELDYNQYVHAEAKDALRKQIEDLTNAPAEDPSGSDIAPAVKKRKPRKAKQPAISAIDELIDSTDWLLAPTPEPQPKPNEEKDDDFGYKAPARKTPPASDSQLSLW